MMKFLSQNLCGPPIPKLKPPKKMYSKKITTNNNSSCKLITYIQRKYTNK